MYSSCPGLVTEKQSSLSELHFPCMQTTVDSIKFIGMLRGLKYGTHEQVNKYPESSK